MDRLAEYFRDTYSTLLARVSVPDTDPLSEHAHDIARLLNLSLLAAPVVVAFVVEFAIFGIWQLAVALGCAGTVMVASPWIYKKTGSLPIARESFLASLFAFKLFESIFLASITSPGSIWFITLPIVAILLGSVISGLFWLAISTAGFFILHQLHGSTSRMASYLPADMNFLYTFSLIVLGLSVTTFVFMVEASRKHANLRLQEATEVIRELAIRDPLTGIFNRRHISARMEDAERRARSGAGAFHICLIDLDRFKQINDTFGHAVGDVVLQTVAKAIQAEVRDEDCFGRYGGEEFIVLLTGSEGLHPEAFAERIRRRVADLAFAAGAGPDQVTVSIGIAASRDGECFSSTVSRADGALYAAKASGRNRVVAAGETEVAGAASHSGMASSTGHPAPACLH
ncbi:GGDEF domain-containing protein [Herbaspirillum sp. SJZ107]|uniref:GGDEF domain-containing protein n=1 Tax=Herbaspirillum sp. SJZ107 TaxID=2572881 RepID=UPI0011530410|nr:GGDEF domain-containing protein [Herbaspirillum sp. SJZ107]TQK11215.1 diguanylate cyclase (GGDEF)-like protein [Herbaspirillum sp. SJZ107]